MNQEMEETMLDLLCKKAVYGLSVDEQHRLTDLQRKAGPGFDAESFELTAAALSMAGVDAATELPKNLRSRIAADAERFFDEREASEATAANGHAASAPWSEWLSLSAWLGWAVAAAACIALAVNLYVTRTDNEAARITIPAPSPEERLSPDRLRQSLIETSPDIARARVGAGNLNGVEPTGDVVWSDTRQAGYLRVKGLPVNDANRETYQLWIVAENQDPKTPVDGGIFNVNAEGEVIIPIDPRVKVINPKVFAITVEKPGGVVVSTQEKVAALAKRET